MRAPTPYPRGAALDVLHLVGPCHTFEALFRPEGGITADERCRREDERIRASLLAANARRKATINGTHRGRARRLTKLGGSTSKSRKCAARPQGRGPPLEKAVDLGRSRAKSRANTPDGHGGAPADEPWSAAEACALLECGMRVCEAMSFWESLYSKKAPRGFLETVYEVFVRKYPGKLRGAGQTQRMIASLIQGRRRARIEGQLPSPDASDPERTKLDLAVDRYCKLLLGGRQVPRVLERFAGFSLEQEYLVALKPRHRPVVDLTPGPIKAQAPADGTIKTLPRLQPHRLDPERAADVEYIRFCTSFQGRRWNKRAPVTTAIPGNLPFCNARFMPIDDAATDHYG